MQESTSRLRPVYAARALNRCASRSPTDTIAPQPPNASSMRHAGALLPGTFSDACASAAGGVGWRQGWGWHRPDVGCAAQRTALRAVGGGLSAWCAEAAAARGGSSTARAPARAPGSETALRTRRQPGWSSAASCGEGVLAPLMVPSMRTTSKSGLAAPGLPSGMAPRDKNRTGASAPMQQTIPWCHAGQGGARELGVHAPATALELCVCRHCSSITYVTHDARRKQECACGATSPRSSRCDRLFAAAGGVMPGAWYRPRRAPAGGSRHACASGA